MSSNGKTCGRRKSRFGCRNCKLRHVKCDEKRPHCIRCREYGIMCNFNSSVPDLLPLSEARVIPLQTSHRVPFASPRPAISNGISSSDAFTYFRLHTEDVDDFKRFRDRTMYTLGGAAVVDVYDKYLLRTAFEHPFLLHGMLALTAAHDRYLGLTPTTNRSLREIYHWSRCTTLFNNWLSWPAKEEQKDPLWSAAGALAILATCPGGAVESQDPPWPLDSSIGSSDNHLEWLHMGTKKMALRKLMDPVRPSSKFHAHFQSLAAAAVPLPEQGAHGVLPDLARLCGLDEMSTSADNPYFYVAHSLSRALLHDYAERDKETSRHRIMLCLCQMHPGFERLLREKDPVALLLLYLWYAEARKTSWWIDFRARDEVPAIREYLEVHHRENRVLQGLISNDAEMQLVR